MPITPLHPVTRMSQDEFREISYTVMGHLFDIHNDFGRFFDEQIYKRELACRMPEVEIEFPITMSHGSFSTTYFLDALIANGAAFEFKSAETLTARHRGQLYNYLLLLDLSHGKLVNMRPESVSHEFVNATIRPADRHVFELVTDRWDRSLKGSDLVLETMVSLLKDWGAGLEVGMYESALTSLLGGKEHVVRTVNVRSGRELLGQQPMRLAADDVAFKVTGFESGNDRFEEHTRRLLRHVDLRAMLWINIALRRVTFTSIEQGGL
jgi:GxxExxY protein